MGCDPSSPGVPPIAVLCKDVQQSTKRLKSIYKYEVLGWQYMSPVRAEFHQEQLNNPHFITILAEVYVGLSDNDALYLASMHNINEHIIHKMTYWDYVSTTVMYCYYHNSLQYTYDSTAWSPGSPILSMYAAINSNG